MLITKQINGLPKVTNSHEKHVVFLCHTIDSLFLTKWVLFTHLIIAPTRVNPKMLSIQITRHLHLSSSLCTTPRLLQVGVYCDVSTIAKFSEPLTRRGSIGISITMPAYVYRDIWFWETMKGDPSNMRYKVENVRQRHFFELNVGICTRRTSEKGRIF